MIIVGWLMSKIEFFGAIKSKLINKMFTHLYIEKRSHPGAQKQKPITTKKHNSFNQNNENSTGFEMI